MHRDIIIIIIIIIYLFIYLFMNEAGYLSHCTD
jgi:hypothetical protein